LDGTYPETIAKCKIIPISVIGEGLGHPNSKLTEIYLDSFDSDMLNDANENVNWRSVGFHSNLYFFCSHSTWKPLIMIELLHGFNPLAFSLHIIPFIPSESLVMDFDVAFDWEALENWDEYPVRK